jgi:hypothetical protein
MDRTSISELVNGYRTFNFLNISFASFQYHFSIYIRDDDRDFINYLFKEKSKMNKRKNSI